MYSHKGFTLLELLIVIAVVAALSAVVILVLNPAELLRQARDSNRVADLTALKKALSLFLLDVPGGSLAPLYTTCYMSAPLGIATTTTRCGNLFSASGAINATSSVASSTMRKVNGTGWIPVNFNAMSTKAPFGALPVDPINNATYYYAYAASSSIFEIDAAKLESNKYGAGGPKDLVGPDGGDQPTVYETGTAPGLSL